MRLSLALPSDPGLDLDGLARRAAALEANGIDQIWLDESLGHPAPLVLAAALCGEVGALRIAVAVGAGPHPLAIAEDAVVVDLASAGRLTLVVSADDADLLRETAEVLIQALAAEPFSHRGQHWQVPAGLGANEDRDPVLTVAPAPAQIELPLWLCGKHSEEVGTALGLPAVLEPGAHCGTTRTGRTRPTFVDLPTDADGGFNADALLARLRVARRERGSNLVVLRPLRPLDADGWADLSATIGRRVRPRLQLGALPDGLEEHWRQVLGTDDGNGKEPQ
jgi:hypothetical protein